MFDKIYSVCDLIQVFGTFALCYFCFRYGLKHGFKYGVQAGLDYAGFKGKAEFADTTDSE